MADNRPPVYQEAGRWIVRASSFGRCSLELARHAAGMQGTKPPQTVRDAWKFGADNEQTIIDRLVERGEWEPLSDVELAEYGTVDDTGQLALELTVGGKVTVRCHPDGIVENTKTGERRVLEVKCMARGSDPETWPMYQWQYSIESAVTGLDVLLVIGWKDVDAENAQIRVLADDMDIREITAPYGVGKIKGRALMIARNADSALRGEFPETCENGEQWGCPFWQLHDGDDVTVLVDEEKVTVVEKIAAEIADLEVLMRDGKAAETKARELRKQMVDVVGSGFKGRAGDWQVSATVSHVEESTRTVKAHDRVSVKVKRVE